MSSQTTERTWVPEWTFGDRLRKIRRERGLSQTELAKALGVKTPSVSGWESGHNIPRDVVAVAKRIELSLGVPAAWTLGLETQTAPPSGGGGATGNTSRYRHSALAASIARAACRATMETAGLAA